MSPSRATDNLFAWGAAGSDIVLIGQIETTTDLALLLRPGLGSLDELDAVRLAVDAPANGFAVVAYAMMARLGRAGSADGEHNTRHTYEVVEVGGVTERFEALAAGAVDATLVAPPLDEIGQQRGMSVAMRVQELAPAYPGLGIVASRAKLDTAVEPVAAYLAALDNALGWMRGADPGERRRRTCRRGLRPGRGAVRARRRFPGPWPRPATHSPLSSACGKRPAWRSRAPQRQPTSSTCDRCGSRACNPPP